MANIPDLSVASLDQDMLKKIKRRSLLPQLTQTSSEEQNDMPIQEDGNTDSRRSDEVRHSGDVSRRRAIDEDRQAMPPPSKLSRPVSMIPPRGSSHRPTTRARDDVKNTTETDTGRRKSTVISCAEWYTICNSTSASRAGDWSKEDGIE